MIVHEAHAPANLALIKYMGKVDAAHNLPTNRSLSLTLENLTSRVRLTELPAGSADEWAPLEGGEKLHMDAAGIARFMDHFRFLKNEWKISRPFRVESANGFPSDCGLASSASAFAALTRAAVETFQKMSPRSSFAPSEMPRLSRLGSGSSCRSFGGPFVLWSGESVETLASPWPDLFHQVIVVSSQRKSVSSSVAHRRVLTSLLFQGRPERAEIRLQNLLKTFDQKNWTEAFEICWAEFMDMHALFETSYPSFGYTTSDTLRVLEIIRNWWAKKSDGPWVTMDAGSNVHLIYRGEQKPMAHELRQQLAPFRILGEIS